MAFTKKQIVNGAMFAFWVAKNGRKFRSAITGRFVNAAYAYKHQKTTVRVS